MNDLIDLVARKAGISTDQAKAAVDAVVHYLGEKLPGPVAGRLESLLVGTHGEGRSLGDAIKHLRAVMGGS
jgi:hypothetical protein